MNIDVQYLPGKHWQGLLVDRRNLPLIGRPRTDLTDHVKVMLPETHRPSRKKVSTKHKPGDVIGTWKLMEFVNGHKTAESRSRAHWYCQCLCGCGTFRNVTTDALYAKNKKGPPSCKQIVRGGLFKKGTDERRYVAKKGE